MSRVRHAIFSCGVCGKKYKWKPQSAGKVRVCECGQFVPVPDAATGESSIAGQSLAGESLSGQVLAGESHAARVLAREPQGGWGQRQDPLPSMDLSPAEIPPLPEPEPAPAAFPEAEPAPPEEDANTYTLSDDVHDTRARSLSPVAPAGKETPHIAILVDGMQRRHRELYAQGTFWREWIFPWTLITIGSIIDALEIQRHLRRADDFTFVGRALPFYMSVNAIGLLSGLLVAKILLRVNFGRTMTSWVKWIGITLATPAVWVLVLEFFLKTQYAGTASTVFGVTAGFLLDAAAFYMLFGRLFDIDALEQFWTVLAANSMKLGLFVAWYLLRAQLNLI